MQIRNIGAVILAAGESSRFGQPKQLAQFRGKSLLRRMIDAASAAGCEPIAVVLGRDGEKIRNELQQTHALAIKNKNWQRGIGTSIRFGTQRVIDDAPKIEAIVFLACDQPFVEAQTIEQLIGCREKTRKAIVASSYSNTLGIPTLFDRSCFSELLELADECGAKSIILSNRERVAEFPFPGGQIDIDTAADYEKLAHATNL